MFSQTDIQIICRDNIPLAASLYQPQNPKAAVLIAPATGIKRRFYAAFASFLAEHNYGVICFDNRGIGGSAAGNINAQNASLVTWGSLDMSAVLDYLMQQFPNCDYHVIGHSAGGQLLGLMDNCAHVRSLFNFASSSGSLHNMDYPFKLNAYFFLNVFIPISNLLFGKSNCQWVGMGEPLPKKVARQWQQWCNGRGYVATEFGKEIQSHHYDSLTLPSMWVYATDDGIANSANVADMTRIFSQSTVSTLALNPQALGKNAIGHMGFFSKKNQDLWQHALDWLEQQSH